MEKKESKIFLSCLLIRLQKKDGLFYSFLCLIIYNSRIRFILEKKKLFFAYFHTEYFVCMWLIVSYDECQACPSVSWVVMAKL